MHEYLDMKKILSLMSLMMLMILASCSSNELVGYWLKEGGDPGEGVVLEFNRSGEFKAYEIDDGNDFVPMLFMTANYEIDGPTIKLNNAKKEDKELGSQSFGFRLNDQGDQLTMQSLGTLKKMSDSEVNRYLRR